MRAALSCEAESFKTYDSFWNNEAKHQKMRMRLASEDEVSLLNMKNGALCTLLWLRMTNNIISRKSLKHNLQGPNF